ncbi:hypothetical protein PHAVU_009G051100 [Phaseolus vulgaris]|uniref:LCR-like protein n=1 Tax=Phaseolus vulgaris TaxID=3885 RepID=V7AS65_PHAVU|nr:hypothetical protein PHAVU_009G051100g [Phaseolus vulgaris]ESW08502.1 hypothetical protein PHAVU_009G051100g [Phaseolus vulgaris]
MANRRIIDLGFVLAIVCIVFLLAPGSAIEICQKGGRCPNEKNCNSYCSFFGFRDGSRCSTDGKNLCCCTRNLGSPQTLS